MEMTLVIAKFYGLIGKVSLQGLDFISVIHKCFLLLFVE